MQKFCFKSKNLRKYRKFSSKSFENKFLFYSFVTFKREYVNKKRYAEPKLSHNP